MDAKQTAPKSSGQDRTTAAALGFAPPGHFYSPHPNLDDIESSFETTLRAYALTVGIDLNAPEQTALFERASQMLAIGPWQSPHTTGLRYYYDNWFFRFGDATAVWHMAQLFRPRRIIEVGSGFSTACWLDTGDRLSLDFALHSIEPYPERVHELCAPSDLQHRVELIERPVQTLPASFFDRLECNDVLFIDSTHVSKSGSDVNYLIFNVLPNLKPGVIVHIHDIFWPFEYPKSWYLEGRAWNECFVLRAFLQFNNAFKILRFNSYLASEHAALLAAQDPRLVADSGASMWLVRN